MFQEDETITNPTIETLMNRRSVRKYTDRKSSKEELETWMRSMKG